MKTLLEELLHNVGAASGTIHRPQNEFLVLTASIGLPDSILPAIAEIPRGKGMAGMAWQTGQSVTTCALRTDPNSTIQTGARAVRADAAIAVPVIDDDHGIIGIVGFAFDPGTQDVDERMARCQKAVDAISHRFPKLGADS